MFSDAGNWFGLLVVAGDLYVLMDVGGLRDHEVRLTSSNGIMFRKSAVFGFSGVGSALCLLVFAPELCISGYMRIESGSSGINEL